MRMARRIVLKPADLFTAMAHFFPPKVRYLLIAECQTRGPLESFGHLCNYDLKSLMSPILRNQIWLLGFFQLGRPGDLALSNAPSSHAFDALATLDVEGSADASAHPAGFSLQGGSSMPMIGLVMSGYIKSQSFGYI